MSDDTTKRMLLLFAIAAALVIAACLVSCNGSLPSRPYTGNHGQGHSPGSECQGQYAQYVVAPTGDRFFLECWGSYEK